MSDNGSTRNSSNVKIDIPCFERVSDNTGKEYTVYKIVIAKPGGTKEIGKRYREFDKLHRILSKSQQLPKGKNIEFPPKRLNPNSATKEVRRGKLKAFLQELCDQNPISPEVLSFLGISQPLQSNLVNTRTLDAYSSSEDLLDSATVSHQPLIGFIKEPFMCDHIQNAPQDILLAGILDGIYGNATRLTFSDVG